MATEADLAAYANNGRDWDQLCQALVWNWCDQFGSAPVAYPDAISAYYATPIVSTDVYSAPPGACLFFDLGAYGHTDIRVDNGRDGMASGRVSEFWGTNAGEVDIADYIAQTGAWPLGWGWTNGANSFLYTPAGQSPTPITESEDEMKPMILWGNLTGPGRSFLWDPVTGLRRPLTSDEVGLINFGAGQPGGQPVVNMEVNQATLDNLPYAPNEE